MKAKEMIEIQAEDYIEEQLLLEEFPEAIWFTGVGNARFYLPYYMKEEIEEKIEKFKGE